MLEFDMGFVKSNVFFVASTILAIFVLTDIYTPAPRHSQNKFCFCSQLFAIFVLCTHIRLCFGIVKVNFASALSCLLYL